MYTKYQADPFAHKREIDFGGWSGFAKVAIFNDVIKLHPVENQKSGTEDRFTYLSSICMPNISMIGLRMPEK